MNFWKINRSLAVLTASLLMPFALGGAEASQEQELEVRTPADQLQGRENVKSVYDQLQELMASGSEPVRMKWNKPVPPPYSKIIENSDGSATLIYQCRYVTAKNLLPSADALVETGYAEANDSQNMLIIKEDAERIVDIEKAIKAMDIASPQVLVEAKVVEILFSDGNQRNLSVLFNSADAGKTGLGNDTELNSSLGMATSVLGSGAADQGAMMNWYPWVDGQDNIKVSFQWMLSAQDAKILASPNIVVSRNNAALINTGQDIPIQTLQNTVSGSQVSTTFKSVGVTLKVEPKLVDGDTVQLMLYPQVSNVLQYQKVTQGSDSSGNAMSYQVPVISVRAIQTELAVRDGQVVMLGGLYNNREVLMQERIPFLSDLPVIGELFTSKNKTREIVQLVFVLKVHILQPDEMAAGILYDPDAVGRESESIGRILENSPLFPEKESTIEQVREEFIENPVTSAE